MENKQEIFNYLLQFLTDARYAKIQKYAEESSSFVLPVMEDIFQFRNAAAIVRSAEACGFHKILALEKDYIFNPNLKVTKGAETWVEIEKRAEELQTLIQLREQGYKIIAVSPEKNATILPNFKIADPVALVFGTEKEGVTEEVLNFADEALAIPMYGFTASFNVSVAAGICFYDLRQKLEKSAVDFKLSESEKLDLKIRWAVNSIKSGEAILKQYLKSCV